MVIEGIGAISWNVISDPASRPGQLYTHKGRVFGAWKFLLLTKIYTGTNTKKWLLLGLYFKMMADIMLIFPVFSYQELCLA